ncbi:putative carboxypeptidase S1 [Fusarium flagelliforme]|uniref:putative carboxypeptidase S1 n=1 Tax=Fusarium flagelliforme TaxID=2675880 RepID=UPI001E8ECD2A|nr:putative carboxypeptidase S1 [Fusarium flagelliforme]KAH7174267.1 putative carboxypeptidase S1 [Fusarium flagelliforme]
MLFSHFLILFGSSLVTASPTPPSPQQSTEKHGDVVYSVYHHAATRSKLSFVKNSGICETTPGVNQYSGYLSVGEDANMWFWFFESRNRPRTAPLVSWFGGGPGNSAQYGMFTQHGPCEILEDGTEPTLREHSLNTHANVLYIDQPIGSGFSYGDGGKVNSTKQCSPYVWAFLQLWFEAFTEYENRELSVFTESYGGHTGTDIVNYILDKNLEIKNGKTRGDIFNVKALSASNAWFDARIQEKANLDFALNNSYRPLINESLHKELMTKYKTEVLPSLEKCDETGTSKDCSAAYQGYLLGIEQPIWTSAMDTYPDWIMADVQPGGVRPPTHHEKYLERSDVQKAIGARVNYTESGGQFGILESGDDAKSFLGELSRIVQDGVQVLIWAGDSDYVCNWVGTKRVSDAVDWPRRKEFAEKELKPYKVQGVQKASFKSVKNLHYARVFDAGHNVWWYQPETSLQIMTQFLSGKGLSST